MASSGSRPDMMPSILQCTGQLLTTKNYPAQNVNSAKVEKWLLATIDTVDRPMVIKLLLRTKVYDQNSTDPRTCSASTLQRTPTRSSFFLKGTSFPPFIFNVCSSLFPLPSLSLPLTFLFSAPSPPSFLRPPPRPAFSVPSFLYSWLL